MQTLVDFLVEYWQVIAFAIIIIVNFISIFCKKVKPVIKLPATSYSYLIDAVNKAEVLFGEGHGREKLNYVIQAYKDEYEIYWNDTMISDYVQNLVENLLSTPHKKEKGEKDG